MVIDDPAVEAHHLLLDIDDEDRFEVVQLAGRMSVDVSTTHVEIGDSRINLCPTGSHPTHVAGLVLGVTVADPLCGGGGEPVVFESDSLAIVDEHPDLSGANAIVRSLASQAAALGLTVPAHVAASPDDPVLDGHPAILEVGARWRARLTCGDQSVRLHAAGMRQVFMNSDARRSAILQPSAVRSKRSANSPTAWCGLGMTPNATSSSDWVPATINTVVVACA